MLARRLAVNVEADVLYFMREIENKQLIKQLDNLQLSSALWLDCLWGYQSVEMWAGMLGHLKAEEFQVK